MFKTLNRLSLNTSKPTPLAVKSLCSVPLRLKTKSLRNTFHTTVHQRTEAKMSMEKVFTKDACPRMLYLLPLLPSD